MATTRRGIGVGKAILVLSAFGGFFQAGVHTYRHAVLAEPCGPGCPWNCIVLQAVVGATSLIALWGLQRGTRVGVSFAGLCLLAIGCWSLANTWQAQPMPAFAFALRATLGLSVVGVGSLLVRPAAAGIQNHRVS